MMGFRKPFLLALLTAASASCAQRVDAPLAPNDLDVGGVAWGSDTAQVLQHFAGPVERVPAVGPNDDGVRVTTWRYRWGEVQFDEQGYVYLFLLSDSTKSTARSVRVGDSVKKVISAYGPLSGSTEMHLLYGVEPNSDFSELGIHFVLEGGRVRLIVIGRVISVT